MFAFRKQKHKIKREILFDKKGNFNLLENYFIENYDTVELTLTNGEILASGVLGGFGGYRCDKKGKTSGYLNVYLFLGTNHKHFDDYSYMKRFNPEIKEQLYLRLFPTRCVLIEKNIIKKHEEREKEIHNRIMEEWRKNPIFGGG